MNRKNHLTDAAIFILCDDDLAFLDLLEFL